MITHSGETAHSTKDSVFTTESALIGGFDSSAENRG